MGLLLRSQNEGDSALFVLQSKNKVEHYKSLQRADGYSTDFCFPGLLGVWLTSLPLPNISGFLSAFCCSMTVIFGTSHHISVGSFSILHMVVINILKTLSFNQTSSYGSLHNFSDPTFMKDYMEALTLTTSITFLTGIIQLLLGCLCLGCVTTYVPKTLTDAYLSAAALHVIFQFTFISDVMLDFHKGPLAIFYNLFPFFLALPKANATSILLFLLSTAALWLNKSITIIYKHSLIAFPKELLLVITVTFISNDIHLHAESSSAVVSVIPRKIVIHAVYEVVLLRFLPPIRPDLSNLSKVILHAFSFAIVTCFLLGFVEERYASLHNYNIASSQELIAVGLCNICSSFLKRLVVSCAVSGTGGRTQLAAAIGAPVMLVTELKLGHFFQMMPNLLPGLAWSRCANEAFHILPFILSAICSNIIWLLTFADVLSFGLDVCLAITMGFMFFMITIRSHRHLMKMVVLGQIPDMNIYRSLSVYRAARETEGIKICCSSISFTNLNHFKTYLLRKVDMKAVPLDKSEMRALILSLSDTAVERKDLKYSCVCPPLPPPRASFRSSNSLSSSVNAVHSKHGDKLSSRTLLVGAADAQCASPGFHMGLKTENKGGGRRACLSRSAVDSSSGQSGQEEQPMYLPCPVHTIILDFNMLQFVDLIGSELPRQMIHMFHNIVVTVLGCHSSVIADFEKNYFFDSLSKERFFLTLHDAVLAALDKHQKPDELEPTVKEFAEEPLAEEQKEISLLLKKNKDFFFSAKNSDNKLLHEEPVSDISCSAQKKAEPGSLRHDTPPLQSDFQDSGWGKRWKYTSNP
ncbi:LOW QUALITY PROTEIN: testis anion transporter 1 [Chlamydotis macqueenii]